MKEGEADAVVVVHHKGEEEGEKDPDNIPHNPYYCLHKNIERRRNALLGGYGLFAKEPIPAGAVIYDPSCSTTIARVDSVGMSCWDEAQINFFEKYAWQVGVDMWCGPTSKADVKNDYVNFLNHSCDPCTWFDGEEILVARRNISTDEEITFDYATCDTNTSTFLVKGCLCGSSKCRKRISPWDYRLPSLQQKYGTHFMPYINEKIATEPPVVLGSDSLAALHQNIELKRSESGGLGLFATDFIAKGSIVWCAEGSRDALVDCETAKVFPEEKINYCMQLDDNLVLSSSEDVSLDASHFMNHSCDPNVWFIGDVMMEARRDIHPGEEITYDYGTCDSYFERIKNCSCGTALCRGKVTEKDYLLPELQERYKHHFALYLLARIYNEWDTSDGV